MSIMMAPLDGLDKALEIQGGMKGPGEVRDDAGVYLYHDIGDYLSREQTYQATSSASVVNGAATDHAINNPSVDGLRYGRYLIAVALTCTVDPTAIITGWAMYIRNSGLQPQYPATLTAPSFLSGGSASRRFWTTSVMIPDFTPTRLPIWCPPGSAIYAYVSTSAGGGTIETRAIWHTSEQQSAGASPVPIGLSRAPVKI